MKKIISFLLILKLVVSSLTSVTDDSIQQILSDLISEFKKPEKK